MNNNQSNNQDQTLLSSMYGSENNANQNTIINNSQPDNNMSQEVKPNNLITITDESSNTMTNNNGNQNMISNNSQPDNNGNQNMMPNKFNSNNNGNQNMVPNNNVPINNVPNSGNASGLNIPNKQLSEDLEKAAKILIIGFITLGVLLSIALVGVFLQGTFNFVYVLDFILVVGGLIGSKEKKPYAAVCGIILGTLLIISLSLIDIILGVFVIVASIKYNGILKKCGVHSNVLLYSFIGYAAIFGITFVFVFAEELVVSKPLTCTRKDGDVIEVSFDRDGIKDLKINGEDATTAELLSYNAQFSNKFYYEAYAEDTAFEKIKKYKNIVELYEAKEFEATCK